MRFLRLIPVLVAGLTASGVLAAERQTVPAQGTPQPVQTPSEERAASTAQSSAGTQQTLDDLIPQSAIDDAESWAAQGAGSNGASTGTPAPERAHDGSPTDGPQVEVSLDMAAFPEPDPLTPDPDRPTFAEIEAPDLVNLPELADQPISDELTLAFPVQSDAFPEREDFTQRYRALSSILALGSSDDTVPQLAARARSDEELLTRILRNYGYYDGEVVRQLSGGRRGVEEVDRDEAQRLADSDPKVRFDILPGARYSFGEVNLGALGALSGSDGDDLRETFGIRAGDPLYADRIVEREGALRLALGEGGYPFAQLAAPELLIDHARNEGDLTLPVDPGGKFVFGEIVSADPDFLSSRHLARIARFDAGEVYRTSLQSDLRRAILATGLVSSVAITPREAVAPTQDAPGEVALDVELERAPLRTISGAIGYGTEDGVKLEAAWEHRNLFPPQGALRLRGILGTREQLASVTYRRSNFRARDQILTVDAYASDIETEAVDARTIALRGAFERVSNLLFQKPLSWQVGAEVLYTDERNRVTNGIARPRQTYLIGGLFGSATIDSSDDLLDPASGFRVTGFLAPEVSHSLGVDDFYLRAQGDASVYHDAGPAVIAARARVATITGADPFDIAPSRRLYAGGGGSVRGYGFQAIGPRNAFDEPTGGASLVEFALEARVQTGLLDGAIEIVPFVDAGSVSTGSTPDFSAIQYGAGVGVRYKTSFGPIRVDLGVPINPTEFDAPVVVYVSLGQAF